MVIQHNIPALNAHRNLGLNNKAVSGNLEKLSSGYRINRAADDAAGLAISEKMRGQIRGLAMAEQNTEHGINLIQTAEGALNETHSILQRMRELAVQSSNGTYQDEDRIQLTKEFNQLKEEIDRIAESTHYNNIKLLDGSLSSGATKGSNAVNPTIALLKDEFDPKALKIAKGDLVAATGTEYTIDAAAVTALVDGTASTAGVDLYKSLVDAGIVTKAATAMTDADWRASVSEYFGIEEADYTWTVAGNVTIGATGVGSIKFVAKDPGAVDPNKEQILQRSNGYAYVSKEGKDAYNKVNLVFGDLTNDRNLIGQQIEINGKTYTFAGQSDVTMDGTTKVANSGDKLEDGSYAIWVGSANFADGTGAAAVAAEVVKAINRVEFGVASDWDAVTGKLTIAGPDTLITAAGTSVPAAANTGTVAIDKLYLSKSAGNEVAKSGGLVFQIGANGGADQRVSLSINAMDTNNLGETSMDVAYTKVTGKNLASASIGTEEDANQAILIITGATDMVSTQRAELGALQNRLEHTLNSLGVSKENLTAAESTIRDVDMAKEMMEFTKNNILVQAAQAMLAQANQLPQGVLQLLR